MTLQMGDRPYAEAAWVPQFVSHPGAPFQYGLAEILRCAFMHSQNHARTCLQQSWTYDVRDLSGDLAVTRALRLGSSVAYGGIARGWRRIPRETSHLQAVFIFALQTFNETQLDLQLTAIDSSANTDTDSQSMIITEDSRDGAGRARVSNGVVTTSLNDSIRLRDAEFPFVGPFRVHTARAFLQLGQGSPGVDPDNPGVCEIRLEARANGINASGTYNQPVSIQPLWAEVFTVMDDFAPSPVVVTGEGATNMSPFRLAFDRDVLGEDIERIRDAQDWAMQRRGTCHMSMVTAGDDWDDYSGGSSSAVGTLDIDATSTRTLVIHTDLWVTPEMASQGDIDVGAVCELGSGDEVTVDFDFIGGLGTESGQVICADTDNGNEVTDTITIGNATNGGELVEVAIYVELTATGPGPTEVRQLRFEDVELAALSAPQNN